MNATQKQATEPVTTPARTLRDAALYLQLHGWIQGAYYDATAQTFTPAACMVGAIGMVCYGGPVDAPALNHDDPGFGDFEQALAHLDRFLLVEDRHQAYEFNDARGRVAGDVITALRMAADTPAEEIEDALRVTHLDAEHSPGTHPDCPACLSQCHCTPGFRCVSCARAAESAHTTWGW